MAASASTPPSSSRPPVAHDAPDERGGGGCGSGEVDVVGAEPSLASLQWMQGPTRVGAADATTGEVGDAGGDGFEDRDGVVLVVRAVRVAATKALRLRGGECDDGQRARRPAAPASRTAPASNPSSAS